MIKTRNDFFDLILDAINQAQIALPDDAEELEPIYDRIREMKGAYE
jgi:hypothetical protein